jgi:hypothetical protein
MSGLHRLTYQGMRNVWAGSEGIGRAALIGPLSSRPIGKRLTVTIVAQGLNKALVSS